MSDVFAPNGREPMIPTPVLQGRVIPNIDALVPSGLGIVSAWGAGSNVRRYVPEGVRLTDAPALDQNITAPLNFQLLNFNFEGLIGPTGPQGPPGPTGLGNLSPYQTADKSTPQTPATADILDASLPLITDGCVFSDAGANKVAWTAGTILWTGTEYAIAANAAGTTNTFIYWDSGDPNVFSTTNVAANATGLTKWIMCINDGAGTPYPAFQNKIIHGGIIQATTVTTATLAAQSITAAKMATNSITAANGAIENLAVDTAQIKNLAVETAKINSLSVETGKIAANAATKAASSYTAGAIAVAATVTIASVGITTAGGVVEINCSAAIDGEFVDSTGILSVLRDATTIYTASGLHFEQDKLQYAITIQDTPSAAAHTYYFKASQTAGTGEAVARSISVQELKK